MSKAKAATKADKPPRLRIADVDRYLEVQAERLKLASEASALEIEEKQLIENMLANVRHTGGSMKKGQHLLSIQSNTTSKKSVAWKQEFIRELGPDAANAVVAAAVAKSKTTETIVVSSA